MKGEEKERGACAWQQVSKGGLNPKEEGEWHPPHPADATGSIIQGQHHLGLLVGLLDLAVQHK